jgi:ADP-heptose:LPS heptosyltransferase
MNDAARVLFVTLSNIGDAILTTPALEALHRWAPERRIDLVCDPKSADLFVHCPYRGDIFIKDKPQGIKGLLRLIAELRRRRYAVAADLRTDGLVRLLRAERRLTRRGVAPRGPHAVQQHMAVLAPLLNDREVPPTRMWIGDRDRERVDGRLAVLPAGPWLAVGPGANYRGKIWPVESFLELVKAFRGEFSALLILGDARDAEPGRILAEQSPLPVQMLCGETSLVQAAAVLARAAVFVGNDSGLGHLASAVGTPTLTLFGIGEPQRYRPWGEHAHCLVGEGADIRKLTVASVVEALRQTLGRGEVP